MNPDADSTGTEEESQDPANPDAAETPEVRALKAQLATEKDRCLRLAADFNNFRKRTAQESERRAASQKKIFIQELLAIIDNLADVFAICINEYAASIIRAPPDFEMINNGVLVFKQKSIDLNRDLNQ